MGLLDIFKPKPAPEKPRARQYPHFARNFAAGKTDRLTEKWTTTETPINQALWRHLRAMRARSNEFCRNNPYGRRFVRLVRRHVVGPNGFSLAVKPLRPDGTVDDADAALIMRGWARWAKRGNCDVTGRQDFNALTRLIVSSMAIDGEVLVRKVRGAARGPHRFQLQVLPARMMDENHNENLQNGNKIRLGVELDAFGKAVAYHLRVDDARHEIMPAVLSQKTVRVPAEEIYHLYIEEEPGQVRGVPWTHTPLRAAHHLDLYDEAALVAANGGAAKMGFFTSPDGDVAPLADTQEGEGHHEFLTASEPGHWSVLPPGYDIKAYDPAYPHETYKEFTAAHRQRLSVGLDVAYASLTGDLSSANYGSLRAGLIDERDGWKTIQGHMIAWLERLFEDWLVHAMRYDAEMQRLPFAKFDKFNAPEWLGRRWEWIDPQKDAASEEIAIRNRTKSRAQCIRERGHDPESVWAEIEAEDARFGAPTPAPSAPLIDEEEEEDDQGSDESNRD